MQIFVIIAIGLVMATFGSNQYLKYSNSSKQEVALSLSISNASNVYVYQDLSYQYLLSNYKTFYNPDMVMVNNIGYDVKNNFNSTNLEAYHSSFYSFYPKYNYSSTYFLYKRSTDLDSLPVMYLITTWDGDGKPVFNGLNQLINLDKDGGDSSYWINSAFGTFNKSNGKISLYSLMPNNSNISAVETTINELVKQGFSPKPNFYLIPVYMYN